MSGDLQVWQFDYVGIRRNSKGLICGVQSGSFEIMATEERAAKKGATARARELGRFCDEINHCPTVTNKTMKMPRIKLV